MILQNHRPDIKVVVPKLPSFPAQAAQHLWMWLNQYKDDYQIGLVGSSLGGYLLHMAKRKIWFLRGVSQSSRETL